MYTFYSSKINMLKTTSWHIEIMIVIVHIRWQSLWYIIIVFGNIQAFKAIIDNLIENGNQKFYRNKHF